MISRDGDLIIFECDGKKCNESFESETSDFITAVNRSREAGWRAYHIGAFWDHYCPSCEEDRRAKKFAKMAELAKKFGDV